jgi:DNA-directed RNA polymerase subunit RPC12/RpoP
MARRMSKEQRKAAFLAVAEETFEELEVWYEAHPEATFGEIEEEARKKRRELMGKALEIVVNGRDSGYQIEGIQCAKCGRRMRYKGEQFQRTIYSLEGDVRLERAYYVCPECEGETIFPPGREVDPER